MSGLHTDTAGVLPTAVPQRSDCGNSAPGASAPGVLSRHRAPVTASEIEQIRAMRMQRVSWKIIARAMGRTHHGIQHISRRYGLRRASAVWTTQNVRILMRMKREGFNNTQIADAIGCSWSNVTKKWTEVAARMRQCGVKPPRTKPPGRPRLPGAVSSAVRDAVLGGTPIIQVAKAFGLARSTVRRMAGAQ